MTGTTIILVGAILMSNAVIVALLLRNPKGKTDGLPKHEAENADNPQNGDEEAPAMRQAGIGKSKFNVEDFEERLMEKVASSVKDMLPVMFEDMIGDLKLKDVEFAEETPSPEQNPEQTPGNRKFQPLSKDETEDAFDTDMRDIIQDGPSAPSANGATLDELEAAVDTAMDASASPEQQAEAGKVLSELKDTQLFERITENDDIDRRVNLCIKMSIRADISVRNKNPKTPEAVRKVTSKKIIADRFEDFNPADLL